MSRPLFLPGDKHPFSATPTRTDMPREAAAPWSGFTVDVPHGSAEALTLRAVGIALLVGLASFGLGMGLMSMLGGSW